MKADIAVKSPASAVQSLLNLIEPPFLIDAFLDHPPAGFTPLRLGEPDRATPAFLMSFGLLTSLDPSKKRLLRSLPLLRNLETLLRMPALFVGTTVSEYAVYPPSVDPVAWIEGLVETSKRHQSRLIILKDLPSDSPLLSEEENRFASELLSRCAERSFFPLWGQALAYVKIDFDSIEDYLQRQSAARRKNLRRKLKASASIEVEALPTGDKRFCDPGFIETLFTLYMSVYAQSEIQFDQLTLPFFRSLLENREANGIVFLYRRGGRLIGFNLCFVQGGNLIDKYIGFLYPEAREANLYFVSWFHNLEYAVRQQLKFYVAGWTDPEVKRFLGASFTFTRHAVYLHNPLLRALLKRMGRLFEADRHQLMAQHGPSALDVGGGEGGR